MSFLPDAELLARLVAFDTVSRNPNLPLADFLADYLDRPGVRVTRLGSADGSKVNLAVRVGPEEQDPDARPGLVLSGHMDVVPADDTDRWESDPFELTDRGDRWVARGAADMKGFLALASNLAREADPDRLRHPLVLLFTYDEELGCLGSEHLVKTWASAWDGPPLPRAAIIGEPTRLRVVRMHKGHLKLRLTYLGVSAHSGYPHLGSNAVERAAEGVTALAGLRRELEAERPAAAEHFPDAPYAPLNVAIIRGGAAINTVPDRCSIDLGIRLLPGMETGPMVERVRRAVAPTASPEGYELEVLSASPPMELAADAPVHRFLCDLVGQSESRSVSFATDAGWLQRLGTGGAGDRGLDCAVFGPGAIEVAHKPNEFLPKADLAAAREHLERAIDHFCGGEAA
ncbi:MAG: acetylornithine deacetylase [Acidobacteriota bacterium]|jgi:acetylornithine deacetylase